MPSILRLVIDLRYLKGAEIAASRDVDYIQDLTSKTVVAASSNMFLQLG